MVMTAGTRRKYAGSLLIWSGVTLGGVWAPGAAASSLWDGSSSNDWFNASNWVWDSIVPLASTTAIIQAASGNTPVISFGNTGVADLVVIGGGANGVLTIGGTLNSTAGLLGNDSVSPATTGTVNVSGLWRNSGNLYIGNFSTGVLNINGGTVNGTNVYVGAEATGNGTLTLTGNGSALAASGTLFVGQGGSGVLTANADTTVTSAGAELASLAGASGTVNIDGGNWDNSAGNLTVGAAGTGTLTIQNGGSVSSMNAVVGASASSSGSQVTVTGSTSSWSNTGTLIVGAYGNGSALDILAGGNVSSATGVIGRYAGASSTVNVNGSGSAWTLSGDLRVAGDRTDASNPGGTGTLNIGNGAGSGGTVSNVNGYIGDTAGSVGNVTINGGTWTNTGNLGVGYYGQGTLLIENGGTVSSVFGLIGWQASSTDSSATVTGSGSSWTLSDSLYVGNLGKGVMTVWAGGQVSSLNGYIGAVAAAGQTSSMTVTGNGSTWTVSGDIVAGYDNNASGLLTIANGASVTAGGQGMLGHSAGSTGTATLDNASWSVGGDFNVGWHGTGNLTIQNGGTLSSNRSYIGNESDGSGSALVTGTGSSWTTSGNLYVGAGGNGTLTVADAAAVTASSIRIAYFDGTTGTLNVGAAEGQAALAAGTLNTANISFGGGLAAGESSVGTLVFNHTSGGLLVASNIAGAGTVKVLGGKTILTGANSYSAGTSIGSGATLQVGNGGTVGSIAGNVLNNGTLAFNRADDLAFSGNISGNGMLEKQGGGTLTLSGGVTHSGVTSVDAGTLALTGTFSGGGVTVANGATLSVADALTATLTGDYNQAAGATLRLGASSDSSFGKLVSSGTANLAGTLFVDVVGGNLTLTGNRLQSVIHANAVNGVFAAVQDNSAIFDFSAVYSGTDVDLTVINSMSVHQAVLDMHNSPAADAAQTLDQIFAAEPGGSITRIFMGVSGGNQAVSNAVSQTLPLLVGGSQQVTTAALAGISRVVQARLESNRGLSSGDSFYGDKKFWMRPFGSWIDQDDRGGVAGYSAKTGGLAFGADATVSDQTRLGVSLVYANADIKGNSAIAPNSSTIDLYQLIGYGSYSLDADTELSFQAGVGQNRNRGQRQIPFAGATAKMRYDSLTATAGLGLGRIYKLAEGTRFVPSVRADYSWIKDEAYSETGADALNLNVRKRSSDELIFTVDGKLLHEVNKGLVLTANLGGGYDVLNNKTSITAAYAGAPGASFTTWGIEASPWFLRAGLGISRSSANGVEISARYDAEQRTDFLNQTASVKVRWAF